MPSTVESTNIASPVKIKTNALAVAEAGVESFAAMLLSGGRFALAVTEK